MADWSTGLLYGGYMLILVLVAVLPMYAFFRAPYRVPPLHREVVRKLLDDGKTEEAAALLSGATGGGSLNRNSTRVTIATVLFVLLSLVTFHLLFFGVPTGLDTQILTTVLAMIASLLSAVVGFYFGGKATEKALDKAPAPDLATLDPEAFIDNIRRRGDPATTVDRVDKALKRLKKDLKIP